MAGSVLFSCFWAFWGIIENFHEGWFHASLLENIGLMFIQYLSPLIIFLSLTLIGIHLPRVGGFAHALAGILLFLFLFDLKDQVAMIFVILPMILLGALYWFGRPQPRRLARRIAIGLPLLTLIVCGIEPVVRVAGRQSDGNLGERLIEGKDGVRLIWAADGAGWSCDGATWHEADMRCRYLAEDGRTQADVPQDIWRLPTVDEAVRSMSRHGANSGGVWDEQSKTAVYLTRPDKESPLWNIHSQVIYWWTATEIDAETAYIIVYDGKVWARRKRFAPGTLGYRCVRKAPSS